MHDDINDSIMSPLHGDAYKYNIGIFGDNVTAFRSYILYSYIYNKYIYMSADKFKTRNGISIVLQLY